MSDYQGPPHMAQQQYQVRYNIQPGQQPMHQMMSQPMPMQAPVQHQQMMMHNPSQQQMQQHHAQMQMQHHMQRPQGMMQMQHHLIQQRPSSQMIQQSHMTPSNQGPGGLPPHSQHQSQPQHQQQSQGQQQFSGHQQQPQQQQQQMPPHSQAHHPQYIQMGASRPSMAVYGHSHSQHPGPGPTTMAPQQHGGQHGYAPQQFQQQPMMRPQMRYVQMPIRQELPHGGPQMVPQSTASQPSALRQALGHVTVLAQPHQQPGGPDMKPVVHVAQVAGPPPPGMQPSASTNGHHVIATVAQSSVNVASHPGGPQQVSQHPSMAQRPHTPLSVKEEMKEMVESPPRPSTQQSRTPMKKPAPKSGKASGKSNKSIAPKANGGPPSASSNGVPSVSTMVGTPATAAAAHHLLGKRPLEELTKAVDANETLDDDVAEAVLQLVDDFVDDLVQSSARLARHRSGAKVESRDVRFLLTRKFNMVLPTQSSSGGAGIPGTSGSGSGPPSKKPAVTAHQQRLALIEKSLKKP